MTGVGLLLAAAVNVIVHVPMDAAGYARARPRYVRALRALGPVSEHRGRGWWFATPRRLVAEPVDHLELRTDPTRATALLAALLPQLRRELHQSSTLAEVNGGWFLRGAATRTVRVSVVTGSARVQHEAEYAMSVAGGGASAEPVGRGLLIWSSVPPAKVASLRRSLLRMGLASVTERSTFDMYP
jgi:hypothetical protein